SDRSWRLRCFVLTPAFATSRSSRPHAATTRATTPRAAAGSATSAGQASAVPPPALISFASAAMTPAGRPTAGTFAPPAATARSPVAQYSLSSFGGDPEDQHEAVARQADAGARLGDGAVRERAVAGASIAREWSFLLRPSVALSSRRWSPGTSASPSLHRSV